jgi:hypothetical protein
VVQQMTYDEALAQHAAMLVGADASRAQGDLTGALGRYRAAGEVLAAIADADGAARRVLDGLALTRQRIGEVLVAQGDLAAALDAQRAELAVRRRIADAQPDDAGKRDDVARAAARIAEVLVLKSALATFQGGGQAAGQVAGQVAA